MSDTSETREQLLRRLSRGLLYSTPLLLAAASLPGTASADQVIATDQQDRGGQLIAVAEAEGEAEGKAEGEAEAEAEGEAEAEAEGEAEGEAEPEG